jgi:hypothetical protein
MHRRFWHARPCPQCAGVSGFADCGYCNGTGVVATPREDIDLNDLRKEWRALAEPRRGYLVSAAALLRARWAEEA